MFTIDDEGYVKALMAHANLLSSVKKSEFSFNFTLESKHRTQCMVNHIKHSLKDFEDILIKYDFLDKE